MIGPRLRELRTAAGLTLTSAARYAGIAHSTLSRLETGRLRPTLDQLVPLARLYGVTLDELASPSPGPADRPGLHRHGATYLPLNRRPGGIQAYRVTAPGLAGPNEPAPCGHEGFQWLHVLGGTLRLVLGDRDLRLRDGESAEFDTRVPHWMSNATAAPLEMVVLFGRQGERPSITVRAAPA
ncbi:helix-turn-helix domain-containing protein [Catenuloplanes atrovinosus]|uniref:Transcriptional regulator with XRE-family HTH domain n=1 Tax=Catenuloplanes atrovinosus TaxID=137266 RepID=A0AAE3YRV2_9ACTN|nr:XRE family transcriptional regulator [Catenuloplanes atrovinosus]MDR7277209.1 transcriptional regulator with XRE-family HTH domain [Catenuloplanes atrovinosus]